ncbi:MAG: hypothetical protein GC178_16720 [Flavobacteriales bacterium]|nr:hypothetical protein [Flavobacteriales bacterium]
MNKLLIALVVSIAGCITWLSITLLSEDDIKIPPPIYITECDDVSDELSVKLRSALIAGLLDTALYQEVNYRGRIIGSVDNREVETFYVPEYDPLVQNPYTRKDAIDSLLGRIDKFYATVESLDSTVLPNSPYFVRFLMS